MSLLSPYPNLVRLFGYSSRSQKDKDAYVNLLDMRMKAKKGLLDQSFLNSLNLTNDDLKTGLKLPLNAYTGTLRASFNKNADFKQGFGICTTGQLLILQLVHDLQQVPTLEMVSTNTDACMFTIEEEYREQAHKVLHDWEQLTGLELEEDKIVKICMRDVNSYCEIVQTGDNDYKVNYKGGEFKGKHKFKWDKENKVFKYSFDDEIEANSLTIISEALLKNLLFDTPLEDTIRNCNDIFRFQIITHLGHTYEKIVQESPNGDIELQRNNRIYAGKKPSGLIVKVKYDGRRDSLANCPPNPIIDNANKCTIDDINKEWYIKVAIQKLSDFKGVKRLTEYKKTELVDMAKEMGIEFDPKIKKDELIKLIENNKGNEVKKMETNKMNIYQKINEMKKDIKAMEFVMDCVQATNLGGKEYPSIGQYYRAINDLSMKYNLLFTWEVVDVEEIQKCMFQPVNKMPQHVTTVKCKATFYDLDSCKFETEGWNSTPSIEYWSIASGSDTCDKGASAASSMAFRNWFDKNFAPSYLTVDDFNTENSISDTSEQTAEPKVPTYIPPERKEELTKEVTSEVQQVPSDEDDTKKVIDNIMKVREVSGNAEWGAATLQQLMSGTLSSADILEISLKVDNKLDSLKGE